mmetsp:Transcript_32652/g.103380  ORF Transcript_32652/g.103380 Transcript_32652/m.103380 type:complete len:228 (-) Transcript_32652:1661-2344(-)
MRPHLLAAEHDLHERVCHPHSVGGGEIFSLGDVGSKGEDLLALELLRRGDRDLVKLDERAEDGRPLDRVAAVRAGRDVHLEADPDETSKVRRLKVTRSISVELDALHADVGVHRVIVPPPIVKLVPVGPGGAGVGRLEVAPLPGVPLFRQLLGRSDVERGQRAVLLVQDHVCLLVPLRQLHDRRFAHGVHHGSRRPLPDRQQVPQPELFEANQLPRQLRSPDRVQQA